MYEVYIKNGIEHTLSGTKYEIFCYNTLISIWNARRYFYWIFLIIQVVPLIILIIFCPVSKLLCILSLFLIVITHTILWFSTRFSYPHEHPVLNCIKHRVLIKGKLIAVREWNNGERERLKFGFYQYYDKETNSHVVNISGINKAFKFHQLLPIRN